MKFVFDGNKAEKLLKERGVDLSEIAVMMAEKRYMDIIVHPTRRGQHLCILEYKGYVHAVPFITEGTDKIILKTAYPTRKLNKKLGGGK